MAAVVVVAEQKLCRETTSCDDGDVKARVMGSRIVRDANKTNAVAMLLLAVVLIFMFMTNKA